jgi:uncharacterized protein YbjT (DUF2867 family)
VTGDLATGQGIEAAVDGAEIIVHCAGSSKGDEDEARNLVEVALQAGAPHLVYISVVGADRIPVVSRVDRALFGYFAAKLAAESVVAESGLPWTTLRATQFYDLTLTTVRQLARLPVVPAPAGWQFQPIDTGEVAARLVELALGAPAGPGARLGGAASVRDDRAAPRVPAGPWQAPADRAGPAPGQGRPRVPRRREPIAGAGGGQADVGRVPPRASR